MSHNTETTGVKAKKVYNTSPTPKQKRAALLLIENTGDMNNPPKSTGAILKQAGYKPGQTKNPKVVLQSKGIQQALIEAGVTDDKIASLLNAGLNAKSKIVMKNPDKSTYMIEVDDLGMRHKYMESAIRVKGYAPEVKQSGTTYNTFIQQNNIDPNGVEAKTLVDNTLEMLMEQTRRVDIEQ